MQQISIHIPDNQVPFMLELLQNFDFVKIDFPSIGKGFTLTDEHKRLIEIEREKSKNPDYLLDWETVKHTLKLD